jgi:hypothetical protein
VAAVSETDPDPADRERNLGRQGRMPDLPPYPEAHLDDDAGSGADRGSPQEPSRALMVVGIVIAVGLALLIVALHLTGVMGSGVHGSR